MTLPYRTPTIDLPDEEVTYLRLMGYSVRITSLGEHKSLVISWDDHEQIVVTATEWGWYRDGRWNREDDGPARCSSYGTLDAVLSWYRSNNLHRDNGPAVIRRQMMLWYRQAELHRTDGPAVVLSEGSLYWFVNHRLHRTDGPAVIYHDGKMGWYLHGRHYESREEWAAAVANPENGAHT